MTPFLIVLLAFALGILLTRVNTCVVRASERVVIDGETDWLLGILVTLGFAGVTLLGLNMTGLGQYRFAPSLPIDLRLIGGATIMGLGAVINNGCFVGSVAQLGRGNLGYLFTFVGLAFALWLSRGSGLLVLVDRDSMPLSMMKIFDGPDAFLTVLLALVGYGVWQAVRHRDWAIMIFALLGIIGALISALDPDWSYASVIDHLIRIEAQPVVRIFGVFALFCGAGLSAWQQHHFHTRFPGLLALTRQFSGGVLMGFGARMIPGGNDTLLLWAAPSGATYGIVAWAIMLASVIIILAAKKYIIPRLPQDPKICGIDDAKVVGDLIAEDVPLFRHVLS